VSATEDPAVAMYQRSERGEIVGPFGHDLKLLLMQLDGAGTGCVGASADRSKAAGVAASRLRHGRKGWSFGQPFRLDATNA